MALYADKERGKYPVWQSLDHVNFLPGSGVVFVTVTVCLCFPWKLTTNIRYAGGLL